MAACGGDGGGDDTTAATSTSEAGVEPYDWRAPTRVALDDEWTLDDCEGDAPFVCVERNGETVGFLEIVEFPVESFEQLREPLADGDEARALEVLAESFFRDLRDDRSLGCGEGYTVEPIEPRPVTTADGPALRYGLVGTTADGAAAERVVQYAAIRGETLVLLAANAYSADGCLASEGAEFHPDVLEAFEPVLDTVVFASPMPEPATA